MTPRIPGQRKPAEDQCRNCHPDVEVAARSCLRCKARLEASREIAARLVHTEPATGGTQS